MCLYCYLVNFGFYILATFKVIKKGTVKWQCAPLMAAQQGHHTDGTIIQYPTQTKQDGRMSKASISQFGRLRNPNLVGLNPGRVN